MRRSLMFSIPGLCSILGIFVVASCGVGIVRKQPPTAPDMATIDPNADLDDDGYTPANGDCNDHDATVNPAAAELCDHRDHDCDGVIDDTCDDDHDGYNVDPGGSNKLPGGDCNDLDPLVNPGAIDFLGDGVDNNCNGKIDEPLPPACDNQNAADPKAWAGAIEICSPWIQSASWNADSDPHDRSVRTSWGVGYHPRAGANFIMLSTGIAAAKGDPLFAEPQNGTAFKNDHANPLPTPNMTCGGRMYADELTVHDYVELTLVLKVPTNVKSFTFNLMFASAEYPEFVGSNYNDKFLAILDSKAFQGNVSFDTNKNPITVDSGFFNVCKAHDICMGTKQNVCKMPIDALNGTGMDDLDNANIPMGGGTGWLTTTAPVSPGETATLRFVLFDEGDHAFDSSVIIDNFQWQAADSNGPATIQ